MMQRRIHRSRYFLPALRLTVVLCCAVVVFLLHDESRANYQLPLSGKARVVFTEGDARVLVNDAALVLSQGMELVAPCTVETGSSRLELLMPDGSALRFDRNTQFTLVKAVANAQNRQVEVDVAVGDAWATVQKFLGTDSTFEVAAPTAVAGVAGTTFRVRVGTARDVTVYVHGGKVRVRPRWTPQGTETVIQGLPGRVDGPDRIEGPERISKAEWERMVSMGMRMQVDPQGVFTEPVPFDNAVVQTNDWVQWNVQRDQARR